MSDGLKPILSIEERGDIDEVIQRDRDWLLSKGFSSDKITELASLRRRYRFLLTDERGPLALISDDQLDEIRRAIRDIVDRGSSTGESSLDVEGSNGGGEKNDP